MAPFSAKGQVLKAVNTSISETAVQFSLESCQHATSLKGFGLQGPPAPAGSGRDATAVWIEAAERFAQLWAPMPNVHESWPDNWRAVRSTANSRWCEIRNFRYI